MRIYFEEENVPVYSKPAKGIRSKSLERVPTPQEVWMATRWRVPIPVKDKIIALCKELREAPMVQEDLGTGNRLTLWWEREEYRYVVDEQDLLWPEFVKHDKLVLRRGRYPVWPEQSGVTDSAYAA